MKVISDFIHASIKNAVVAIGNFDGMHCGHLAVIEKLKHIAVATNGNSVAITFDPHPRIALNKRLESLKLLSTIDEKKELLESTNLDYLFVLPFTQTLADMSYKAFIDEILIQKIGMSHLVIGYDQTFGHDNAGTFNTIAEYAREKKFHIDTLDPVMNTGEYTSSSKIRKALLNGDIRNASVMLGYDYFMSGTVVTGEGLGRQIGFPTANLSIEHPYKLLPKDGVYDVDVVVKSIRYQGMLFIGTKSKTGAKVIEINIFNFNEDIYGCSIRLYFKHRVRDTILLKTLDELKAQLEQDRTFIEKTYKR